MGVLMGYGGFGDYVLGWLLLHLVSNLAFLLKHGQVSNLHCSDLLDVVESVTIMFDIVTSHGSMSEVLDIVGWLLQSLLWMTCGQ
ncbi:hypothetical protein BO86DRAFT_193511 [Aspergillus japonicus CBS 114.51]|uniref:Uncharacterized protein n=1 Tax=Aspergillus japonicus CBS 114.51 TaxID=1448312 RepID=A0A8T8WQZ9_ASPJA|nr:hypothetical protein BO86DRAFT_193511 [Aspergillus japonicus CBS 114.51]RAH78276.1 hypothetical protein BO86DRAFT_193511 [Aspergillus japonicus CBS 114.51]